jgi:hypothetical protein
MVSVPTASLNNIYQVETVSNVVTHNNSHCCSECSESKRFWQLCFVTLWVYGELDCLYFQGRCECCAENRAIVICEIVGEINRVPLIFM